VSCISPKSHKVSSYAWLRSMFEKDNSNVVVILIIDGRCSYSSGRLYKLYGPIRRIDDLHRGTYTLLTY
jgi:hypothetical protein